MLSRSTAFLFAAFVLILTAAGNLSGQPVSLFQNNVEATFHFERDQVIAYTLTQIAVRRNGSTTWQVHDLPYNTDTKYAAIPEVYHANGDTILVACFEWMTTSTRRTTLFRSVDGGRTWRAFYLHNRSCRALYISGQTVLIDGYSLGSTPITVVDDAGHISSTTKLDNYPGLNRFMISSDRRYALCEGNYGVRRLSFDDDQQLVISEPFYCHGLMATQEGPAGFWHTGENTILYYPDRTDTIPTPPTFRGGGSTALFDAQLYLLGYGTLDGTGPDYWYRLLRQPLDPNIYSDDFTFSVFDNPTVHGDTLFWGDHTRFRYVVRGNDSIHTIDCPDGWSKPAAVSWIDGALCYYMGREAITSYVPDFCNLLTVDPDAPLGAVVQDLPFTLGQTTILGSKVVNGSSELRTAIHTDYPSHKRLVYDIDPVQGASLRDEIIDGSDALLLAWHERNDTAWFCRYDPSSEKILLIMQLPNHYQRSLGALSKSDDQRRYNVTSIHSYRGSVFILCEVDGGSVLLKCTPSSWATSPIVKVLDLPALMSWNRRYQVAVMDSCLTVSGADGETPYSTTYDGITFDTPNFGDIVTQQGNTNIVLRGNKPEGRYNVYSTTSGISLTALGTIYFHQNRKILGAYTVNGGIAVATNEGTWLLPLRPFVPTGVEDALAWRAARREPIPAHTIRLPYQMTFDPSPFIRQIDIYGPNGQLVATRTVSPGSVSITLNELPIGSYFVCIPGQTGLDVRRYLTE